ncbi:Vacuolar protein sorting-associated protein 9A [Hibiscus syriacus]|uniref:Vacuolar protein sorting-associated protein 9A n=1 Tax=Hibiscus syriacus TaxID=106335 RepID=A0A6A3CQB4_HIBSY|nr:Vacuolar protein sorting-associated protein 9A [Hibiscus syriacus]
MTKLFASVFASLPDDVKHDEQLSEKMALVQQFVRPENLDIKPTFQNETSWLLAQKELQKINMYKAPRDKLVFILNCCKVINNLLLNASIASNKNPPGADDFLPVLIYVTIKANPQFHSNLLYIQRYRRQSRLVSEAAYFFTNMLSAEAFISNLDGLSNQINQIAGQDQREPTESRHHTLKEDHAVRPKSSEGKRLSKEDQSSLTKIASISQLENRGATMLLEDHRMSNVFREYPYMFAHAGDFTINDVEDLLNNYKQLVFKYVCLLKGSDGASAAFPLSRSQAQPGQHVETVEKSEDDRAIVQNFGSQKDTDREDDGPNGISYQESTKPDFPKEEAAASSEHNHDDTSEQ